jgi:hypothetical protein
MSDYDREPEPVRERHRTTVIETGDRGGGGAIALILLLIVVAGIAWFLMRSAGGRSGTSQVGVNVSLPKAVNLNVPDRIDVKSGKASSNSAR